MAPASAVRRTVSGHVELKTVQTEREFRYLADNEFIHRGYRVGHDAMECLKSCVCAG